MEIIRALNPIAEENAYLIWDAATKKAVIVDPGAPSASFDRIIAEEKLIPEMILLTHGHFDHIGGADYYRNKFAIEVWIHGDDRRLIEDPYMNGSESLMGEALSATADHFFKEGDVLSSLEFRVIHTPGHTAGCSCFQIGSVLFSGDTLFQGSVGRWDLPTGDVHMLMHSIQKLMDMPAQLTVYPGHGPSTSIEKERQINSFYQMMQRVKLNRSRIQGGH